MRSTLRFIGLASATLALASTAAFAFKPNDVGHLGITTESLTPIERTLAGQTLRFSDRALDEIRDANRNTDIITFFGVAEHFDDEAFQASSQRLIDLKESVIQKSVAGDGEGARADFGTALHTAQDFYSHSNWVELGMTGIETRLGREVMQPLPLTEATCPASPGVLGAAGLTDETTGYFPFPDPCALGGDAGTPPGKCRHGVEFLCPDGINKDAPDRVGFEAAHGFAVAATTDYTNQILDDPRMANNASALATLMGTETIGGRVLIIDAGLSSSTNKSYPMPVDSTVEKLKVLVNVIGTQLLNPSGQAVVGGNPGVTINDENGVRKIVVVDPAVGVWTVRMPTGEQQFTLKVGVKSPLQIDRFEFVTFVGRVGHEGYVSIAGAPRAEKDVRALARATGPVATVAFQLVDVKGKPIQPVTLVTGDPEAADGEFLGTVRVPGKPFRLQMIGKDTAGTAYQRTFPTLFTPKEAK